MSERGDRLLRALAIVRGAEPLLSPSWDARTREGYVYLGGTSALDDRSLAVDLEELAREDYLERVFVERISLCDNCGSHAVNVFEACLTCSSSNLHRMRTLLHFRCGYVGPVDAFALEPVGRRCPKCRKLLVDLGTDHDSPGEYYDCRNCNAEFQVPEVGARCLSCGSRYVGTEMQRLREHDVFAYRMTPLGTAALAENRVPDPDSPAMPELAAPDDLVPRHLMLAAVEDERLRKRTLGDRFAVLVFTQERVATPDERRAFAVAVRRELLESDKLGRLDDRHLVALLPGASGSRARSALASILALAGNDASQMRGSVVELPDGGTAEEVLDRSARDLGGPGHG